MPYLKAVATRVRKGLPRFLVTGMYVASNKQDHGTGGPDGGATMVRATGMKGGDGWPILIWTPPQAVVRPI